MSRIKQLYPILPLLLISCSGVDEGKPNIIIVLADDQGYNDLGCYGSALIKTPNLDRMAREGLRLTNYYSGAPLSSPSRAALMTGCYPARLAEYTKEKNFHTIISPHEVLLPQLLKDAGYKTAAIGKWHLAGSGGFRFWGQRGLGEDLSQYRLFRPEIMPCQRGFDYYYGIPHSNDNVPCTIMRNNDAVEFIGNGEGQRGITTRYTDEALAFMERSCDAPFFLYLAHNMPHTPLWPSEEFEGRSEYGFYGDCVEEIDWNMGRIIAKLKELEIEDNTIIIYTSDNGPWIDPENNHDSEARESRLQAGTAYPLRGMKMTAWDGGSRVPCIIKYPAKIEANRVSDQIVNAMDLLPTLASIAGAEVDPNIVIDGFDTSDFLFNGKTSPRNTHFFYKYSFLHGVRHGDWKLVLPSEAKPEALKWYGRLQEQIPAPLLYNLREDIAESRDLSEQYPEVVESLMQIVKEAQLELGDGREGIIGKGLRHKGEYIAN